MTELYDTKWCLYRVRWSMVATPTNFLKEDLESLKTRANSMCHWLSVKGQTKSRIQSHITDEDLRVNGRHIAGVNNSASQYLQMREDSADSDEDLASPAYTNCVWKHLRMQDTNQSQILRKNGIIIELEAGDVIEAKTATRIVFLGQGLSMLMANIPTRPLKAIVAYFSEEIGASIEPLELSPLLLRQILGCYELDATSATRGMPAGKTAVQAALNDLRITLSFAVAVSPALRSMDISLSTQALEHMIGSPRPSHSDRQLMSDDSAKASFLSKLEMHLRSHTGMWVPLDIPLGTDLSALREQRSLPTESEAVLVLVRAISCAAFSLSNRGRLRLSSKVLRELPTEEGLLIAANSKLLEAILKAAEAQTS